MKPSLLRTIALALIAVTVAGALIYVTTRKAQRQTHYEETALPPIVGPHDKELEPMETQPRSSVQPLEISYAPQANQPPPSKLSGMERMKGEPLTFRQFAPMLFCWNCGVRIGNQMRLPLQEVRESGCL